MPADDLTIAELLASLCDETISTEEMQRLDRLILADAEARRQYLEYLDLHARLSYSFHRSAEPGNEGRGMADSPAFDVFVVADNFSVGAAVELPHRHDPEPRIPSPEPLVPPFPALSPLPSSLSPDFVGGPVFSYLTAAVIMGIGALGLWAYKITHHQHIAEAPSKSVPSDARPEMVFVGRITGMVDVKWSDDKDFLPPLGYAYVSIGRKYKLDSGLMQITYDSGAKVILEGPCTYEVESHAGGYLSLGKLTARVESGEWRVESEENATNQKSSQLSTLHSPLFSVRTPTAVITDLGTEFGVEVSKEGTTTSRVFRGSVRVQVVGGDGEQKDVVLRENESAQVVKVDGKPSIVRRGAAGASGFVLEMPPPRRVRDSQAYAELVLSLNPVVYYRMERPKDGQDSRVVSDLAGGGHHGELRLGNELEWWPYRRGRWGDALWFRGQRIGDYVLVSDYLKKAVEDKLSVSVWVTAEKWMDRDPIIVANCGTEQAGQSYMGFYKGKCDLVAGVVQRDGTKVGAREGRDFPVSEWQHVAFVVDGTRLRLYRNGEEVARAECDGLRPDLPMRNLVIGGKKRGKMDNVQGLISGRCWRGMIDELAVFNAALSAEQILMLYTGKPLAGGTGVSPVKERGGTGVSPVKELGRGTVGSTGERPVPPTAALSQTTPTTTNKEGDDR